MATKLPDGSVKRENPPEATEDAVRSAVRNAKSPPEEPELPIEVPEEEEGGADEIESLRAQLALCQERSRETAERMKEAHDRMLRAAADLENFKKRAQREKEELQKFGNEKLLRDLLPVLDNLDRALAAVPASDPLAAGVSLVRSSFEQVLTRNGVKSFSAMGQPFDPAMHEALMQVASTEAAPGTVVVEHARGFTLNDRLVRPALVGVAVAPSGDQGGEGKE